MRPKNEATAVPQCDIPTALSTLNVLTTHSHRFVSEETQISLRICRNVLQQLDAYGYRSIDIEGRLKR